MNSLKKANAHFLNKEYDKAIELYQRVKYESPELESFILVNEEICKRRLLKGKNNFNDCVSDKTTNFIHKKDDKYINKVINYKKNKNLRKAKVAVFTAITGGYDNLINPELIVDEWDYILYTDGYIEDETVYEIRPIPFQDIDPVRMARYIKINAHKILNQYEYCIWIDGNVLLKNNFYYEINKLISKDNDIVFRKHPDRNSPYDEIAKCQELLKDDFSLMSKQLKKYKSENYIPQSPLFETNVILRKTNNEKVIKFNEIWWNELYSGSRRDQLSVNYALDHSEAVFSIFNEDCDIRNPSNKYYFIFNHNNVLKQNAIDEHFAHISQVKLLMHPEESRFYYATSFDKNTYQIPFKFKALLLKGRELGYREKAINCLNKELTTERDKEKKAIGFLVLSMLCMFDHDADIKIIISALNNVLNLTKNNSLIRDATFLLNELIGAPKESSKEKLGIDFFIQLSNSANKFDAKVACLNKIFYNFGLLPIRINEYSTFKLLDSIHPAKPLNRYDFIQSDYKVSIIVSCYNVEDHIFTSLTTLINQSWRNIEILCVDDNSSDKTVEKIQEIALFDKRIKLFKNSTTRGTYANRNFVMKHANGDFITVADADDWHHPQKIQYQVEKLISSNSIANVASWLRTSENLIFNRRNALQYKHINISSLMFRKKIVLDALGGWDEVMFAADGEFYKRLKLAFPDKVEELPGITSLGRYEEGSLTNNSIYGYFGFAFGVRKEYLESYEFYHKSASLENLKFSPDKRHYPVPASMLPHSNIKNIVDEIFISDLRDEELAHKAIDFINRCEYIGKSWSVCHLPSFEADPRKKIHEDLRAELSKRKRVCIVYGETILSKTAVFFGAHLPILEYKFLPSIQASEITIVITNPISKLLLDKLKSSLSNKYSNKIAITRFLKPFDINISTDKGDFYTSLQVVDMADVNNFEYRGSAKIVIIMPCIDLELGNKTAEILLRRAAIDCTVVIAYDSIRQGFIKTLNKIASKTNARYICYVAQDAYPGREWLKIAYEAIYKNKKGLLAFNDGKWHGRIASFGMVNKEWISSFYQNSILHQAYKAHKADNEITVLARLDNSFIYCSDSVLLEVDYDKDSGGSNEEDDLVFKQRFNNGFEGRFELNSVNKLRKEYKVKI